MMYDELIKNLRICSRCDFGQNCNGCTQKSDDAFCCDKLLHEAADAIEELSKPRWVPVTERLPEEHVFVLIRQEDDRMMVAERVDGDWWYRYFAYDVDRWDENEQGTITHWMPLPEPPKDGET